MAVSRNSPTGSDETGDTERSNTMTSPSDTTTFDCTGCEFITSDPLTIHVISAITESCPNCEQVVFEDEFTVA
jgi:hypothetical protein